jgi:hypothetical protein
MACNGSARLCAKPLGEVAFATTHNSMSSPADHFLGPNQGRPIRWQLEHGIHGFQIDAYEGVREGAHVWTDLSASPASPVNDLSAALVAVAQRIHESIGAPPPGTETRVYLCHTFCEMGAVTLQSVARDMREYLDQHPHEVLVLVVEDHVAPERFRAVLDATGLGRELATVVPGAPLPTLAELIRAKTRLLVTLENGDGGPQLPNAFTGLVEETPFTFLKATELTTDDSCRVNRGTDAAPIFQFNHWVTPQVRAHARLVNSRVLAARVRRCTRVRGRRPTLVAVDFAERSDVFRVVDRLNRVRAAS